MEDEKQWYKTQDEVLVKRILDGKGTDNDIDKVFRVYGIHGLIATENHIVYRMVLRSGKLKPEHIFHMYRTSPRSRVILKDNIDALYELDIETYENILYTLIKCENKQYMVLGNDNNDFFRVSEYFSRADIHRNAKETMIEDMFKYNKDLLYYIMDTHRSFIFQVLTAHVVLEGYQSIFAPAEELSILEDIITNGQISENIGLFIRNHRYVFEAVKDSSKSFNSPAEMLEMFDSFKNTKYTDTPIKGVIRTMYIKGIVEELKNEYDALDLSQGSFIWDELHNIPNMYIFKYVALLYRLTIDKSKSMADLYFITPEGDISDVGAIYEHVNNIVLDTPDSYWDEKDVETYVSEHQLTDADEFLQYI